MPAWIFMAFIKSCSILEMTKVQHVKLCLKPTKITSEISCPTGSCLAQLVRHGPEDPEVLVSIPTGGNFWQFFFCSSLCKDLSDNLTETPIVKHSIECQDFILTLNKILWSSEPTGHTFRSGTCEIVWFCKI